MRQNVKFAPVSFVPSLGKLPCEFVRQNGFRKKAQTLPFLLKKSAPRPAISLRLNLEVRLCFQVSRRNCFASSLLSVSKFRAETSLPSLLSASKFRAETLCFQVCSLPSFASKLLRFQVCSRFHVLLCFASLRWNFQI